MNAAQGGVEGDESLVEAARRELAEETGPNMDVWTVGRVPAGAYSYPFPAEHIKKNPGKDFARVSFAIFISSRSFPQSCSDTLCAVGILHAYAGRPGTGSTESEGRIDRFRMANEGGN